MIFKPKQAVMYRDFFGSLGRVEAANHYGGFYVRWNYGRDIKEEPMTGLSSVHPEDLLAINEELYKKYEKCCFNQSFERQGIRDQIVKKAMGR